MRWRRRLYKEGKEEDDCSIDDNEKERISCSKHSKKGIISHKSLQ